MHSTLSIFQHAEHTECSLLPGINEKTQPSFILFCYDSAIKKMRQGSPRKPIRLIKRTKFTKFNLINKYNTGISKTIHVQFLYNIENDC